MGRLSKHFIHGTVVELTSRVEEGLPFIATSYMRLIVESYLARAQEHYPIRLLGFIMMANHFHMLAVVDDPGAVSNFVGYFKRETAHAINRLLGRDRHTVWDEGFDSPIILDAPKVVDRLVYFYTNPQDARLENTIEEYPNVNSWSYFLSGDSARQKVPTFSRPAIPTYDGKTEQQIYNFILREQEGEAELHIEPFAWLSVFPDTVNTPPQRIIEEVVKRVRAKEQLIRLKHGEAVVGAQALRAQDIRQPHAPKKKGKKTSCLASERMRRVEFLAWVRDQTELAKKAIQKWLRAGATLLLPPGFFAPGGRLSANVLPAALPL